MYEITRSKNNEIEKYYIEDQQNALDEMFSNRKRGYVSETRKVNITEVDQKITEETKE